MLGVSLALLVNAPDVLTIAEVAEISGCSDEILRRLPFVRINRSNDSVEFLSGVHRQFLESRLSIEKSQSQLALVDFYNRSSSRLRSLRVLPGLLNETRDFETLKNLVDGAHLTGVLNESHDLSLVRRHIDSAFHAAQETTDVPAAVFQAAVESLVLATYERFEEMEPELRALCALGRFAEAIGMAERAVLPEDQLQALATIGQSMKEETASLPDEVITSIVLLVDRISATTPLDRATAIATRVFPILPEQAIRLVERCAGDAGPIALDRALLQISLGSPLDPAQTLESLGDRLSTPASRDVVASTSRLSGVSPAQLLAAVDGITRPRSALALIRGWCNVNREEANADPVVERALDLVEAKGEFAPSVRQMRQILEPLVGMDREKTEGLVRRFESMRGGLEREPWIEDMRVDLLLAQVIASWNPREALERVQNVTKELDDRRSIEERCLGRAHVCRTLSTLPAEIQQPHLVEGLRTLENEFRALMSSSADHLLVP